MAKKDKKPQDLTDYSLRGIRNSINDLWDVVEDVNARLAKAEITLEGNPLPVFRKASRAKKNIRKKK